MFLNSWQPDGGTANLTKEERLEKLFSKLDFFGVQSWSNQDRNDVTSLKEEYHHLFALDDLQLGKTDMVKHSVKLNNHAPFKERYCSILPHQFDEVRKHLQEMLDIGSIWKLHSPWASTVVLVRIKDGSLRFCTDLRKWILSWLRMHIVCLRLRNH